MSDNNCKHCDLPMTYGGRGELIHATGVWLKGGSRTCTSAVADIHEGPWTHELVARRNSLRGKVATRKRIVR